MEAAAFSWRLLAVVTLLCKAAGRYCSVETQRSVLLKLYAYFTGITGRAWYFILFLLKLDNYCWNL